MTLSGGLGEVVLELHAGIEPEAARRIALVAENRGYDEAPLIRKRALVTVGALRDESLYRPVALRRTGHTTHRPGAIGWSWSATPGDGRGGFYMMVEEERGYDAAYGIVGHVAAGLEILARLPIQARVALHGRGKFTPATIASMRVLRLAA
jgi:cyclophilin family peptidyl-prolyl cis-trans isomerase